MKNQKVKAEFILCGGGRSLGLAKTVVGYSITRTHDADEAFRHHQKCAEDKWRSAPAVYVLTDDVLYAVPLRGEYGFSWTGVERALGLDD